MERKSEMANEIVPNVLEVVQSIPGIVSLGIRPSVLENRLADTGTCYDYGCFSECIDSCDCIDSECDPSPEIVQ